MVKKLKRQQLLTINNTVAPFYLEKNPSPHCIIELSPREVKRMKENTIHLGGMSIKNDKQQKTIVTSYNQVQYGKNVKSGTTNKYHDGNRYDKVNLNKMSRNFIAITANKEDCIDNTDDVASVPASYRRRSSHFDTGKVENGSGKEDNCSGIMLLFLGVMDVEVPKRESSWSQENTRKLKYAKNNILASSKSKHFDSDGQYYSFGNKGNFGMIGNSSVGIYGSKVYRNTDSNNK